MCQEVVLAALIVPTVLRIIAQSVGSRVNVNIDTAVDCCIDVMLIFASSATGAETATACPEWRLLSPALQNVLTAGWLDKQRQ